MSLKLLSIGLTASGAALVAFTPASAQDADLAKQLSNPIASLISVPFQFNYDSGYGPDKGDKVTLNIQPVIPISLNEDWNLISRTIVPVVWQEDVAGPSGTQFGLGDTVQSLFFSPKAPGSGGIIWGARPVFLLPTGTDPLLGGEKWGAGPTAVVLKQSGPWTYGILANHIWSFAGDDSRSDISTTFLQPFISYTTPDAWTFALNTESTYDWESESWSVPINFMVSKLVTVNKQPISLQAGELPAARAEIDLLQAQAADRPEVMILHGLHRLASGDLVEARETARILTQRHPRLRLPPQLEARSRVP